MQISLTVVIPTYNRPYFARRAIDSVLGQRGFSGRIVLVNDGSDSKYDHEYLTIVKSFAERIDYVKNCDSKGVSTARNTGVRLATTEWILFLDDDDEIQGQYLSELLESISKFSDVDLFWCDVQVQGSLENHKKNPLECRTFNTSNNIESIIYQALKIGASYGLAIRRTVFTQLSGFDCTFKVGEDTEFIIRLISQGYVVKPIKYFGILKHEEHNERLSFGYERYSDSNIYELLLDRYSDFFAERANARLSVMLWSLYVHLSNKNYSKADKFLPLLLELTDEVSISP